MNCPRCGVAAAPGAAFCASCGLSLAAAPAVAPPPWAGPPPPVPTYAPAPAAPSAAPVVFVVVVVIVALLVIGGVAAVVLLSAPTPAQQGECVAVHQGSTLHYGLVSQSNCQDFCDTLERNSGVPVTSCTWEPR